MAEEPPRRKYALKYVCMYVCMYDCCGGAGVAKTSFCGLLPCFLSPVVVILGPGLLVVLGTVGTRVVGSL